jgi:hypothetical protein
MRWGFHAVCIFSLLAFPLLAAASEYRGQVVFGGFPVPGATITATQGTKNVATVTDQGGVYSFADLSEGAWKIKIEMQCFSTIHADVTVSEKTSAGKWELALLPLDQLKKLATHASNPTSTQPVPHADAVAKKPDTSEAIAETPKPPDASQDSSDGFLVNGSTNNAATSQYALSQAFGNKRAGSKSIYNGGVSAIMDNSAFDARPYSLSGLEMPKGFYNRFTGGVAIGGPIKIPRLLPRGPNFFADYEWTRNQTAQMIPGIVPTTEERAGNLSGLLDTLGQPVTIYNPATGLPFIGNIPVSSQAKALLNLYPLPLPELAGNALYNYQAAVLNSSHQDALESRLDKTLGRKDALWGGFNLQSTRAGNTNLFGFVDTTDTLGINTNINWYHHFNPHLTATIGYKFSRLRTLVASNFENRQNVSDGAGIAGNDQDAADWGPPTLNFASGIAVLSDANSSFNRNRTDAFSVSAAIYRRKHNITVGGDLRKQQYNDFFEQNPRGAFTFTGAATAGTSNGVTTGGSDLADFLLGVPDTSSIAFGNADKYFREHVYDAYATDDWRILSVLTINAGLRWEYGAPMTEIHGSLVNLDLAPGFTAEAQVKGSDPVGPITGDHYPSSLVRPDWRGVEPRVGVSWRPIPASTIVVRAGYGIYHDTSVYLAPALQMAQQYPLSTSLSVQNSTACSLTLANGFPSTVTTNGLVACSGTTADTFAIDPDFRVGYAQTWQLAVQRDLPAALQLTATYLGVKGTHGVQQFLPNTYAPGAINPCPDCPLGFVYRSSGGNSSRQSGQLQLRRRLRNGFTASLLYTYSKSIDDDAQLGGQGHITAGEQNDDAIAPAAAIAQNWLNPRAERALSTFDQRHLLNLQAQYTSGEGLGGGDLMHGKAGKLLKEWTLLASIVTGTGLPETPTYFAAVSGTGFSNTIRPSLTGSPIYTAAAGSHLNRAAYKAPTPGQWGTAGRDSITGPDQFSLNASLARTFRPGTKYFLDARVNATNLLNHAVFTGWNTTWNSTQFGSPVAANAMRSLQTTLRLRF